MEGFEGIIGYEGIKTELRRICDVLCNPDKYSRLGVTPPKGLLLHGAAGVGKTTIAKCFIKETGRKAFICRKNMPDGEFVNEIRHIFEEAKKNAPCIVLLDDMDKFSDSDSDREADSDEFVTIQACVDDVRDMDIFVVATTNALRKIPKSLRRHGRFDTKIEVRMPQDEEAAQIVSYYLSKKKAVGDIDAAEVARMLDGKSCATLESVINEAGIYAGCEGKDHIDMDDIIKACVRVVYENPDDNFVDRLYNMKKVAYHEAGHAVVSEILMPGTVNLVSVSGGHGDTMGFCSSSLTDGYWTSKEMMEARMAMILGGRAATEVVFGTTDAGANDDLHRAFDISERFADYYCSYGFDSWIQENNSSEHVHASRDIRMAMDVERMYQRARKVLIDNRPCLQALAGELVRKKALTGRQVRELISKQQKTA